MPAGGPSSASGRDPLELSERGKEDAAPLLKPRAAEPGVEVDDAPVIEEVLDVQTQTALVAPEQARAGGEHEVQLLPRVPQVLLRRAADGAGSHTAAVVE